jgi:hypothetical protein
VSNSRTARRVLLPSSFARFDHCGACGHWSGRWSRTLRNCSSCLYMVRGPTPKILRGPGLVPTGKRYRSGNQLVFDLLQSAAKPNREARVSPS